LAKGGGVAVLRKRWEYCAIVGIGGWKGTQTPGPPCPGIWYFGSEVQIVEIRGYEKAKLAEAIYLLGLDGWEMVGAVPESGAGSTDNHTLYFKRPIGAHDYDAAEDDEYDEEAYEADAAEVRILEHYVDEAIDRLDDVEHDGDDPGVYENDVDGEEGPEETEIPF
jgi:hypothetical protein